MGPLVSLLVGKDGKKHHLYVDGKLRRAFGDKGKAQSVTVATVRAVVATPDLTEVALQGIVLRNNNMVVVIDSRLSGLIAGSERQLERKGWDVLDDPLVVLDARGHVASGPAARCDVRVATWKSGNEGPSAGRNGTPLTAMSATLLVRADQQMSPASANWLIQQIEKKQVIDIEPVGDRRDVMKDLLSRLAELPI